MEKKREIRIIDMPKIQKSLKILREIFKTESKPELNQKPQTNKN